MAQGPSRWESSAPIRYPDPDIIVLDKRFRPLVVPMAAIERIATGFRFTEMGQPINQPLMLFPRAKFMRALGCRVDVIDGEGHYLRVPKYQLGYLRLGFLEHPHALTKHFATHRLVVATKT